MAKREQLTCTGCGRVGLTARGRVRWALYLLALLSIAALVLTDLLGLTALGDQLWAVGITIMLVSLGLRLLVRGDRCPDCGEPAVYLRGPRDVVIRGPRDVVLERPGDDGAA